MSEYTSDQLREMIDEEITSLRYDLFRLKKVLHDTENEEHLEEVEIKKQCMENTMNGLIGLVEEYLNEYEEED